MLLHTTEGAVVMTGYMECQEFAHETNSVGISPLRPMMNRKLGTNPDLTGRAHRILSLLCSVLDIISVEPLYCGHPKLGQLRNVASN